MRLTKEGIELMKEFEGLRLESYKDPVGIWTIGWGNTYYENGNRVGPNEKITKDRADELYFNIVSDFSKHVDGLLTVTLSGGQFSALVSLAYNIGVAALASSTLLRLVNQDPCNNDAIYGQFLRWNKAGGKVLNGLTRRRKAEAEMYING